MSKQPDPKTELKRIQCFNCLTQYSVPVQTGCSICPVCGHKSCSD